MKEKANVGTQFGLALSALVILTASAVWLGQVLASGKMGTALAVAIGVLVLLAIASYIVVYRPLLSLSAAERELDRVASTDALTGRLNRDRVLERMKIEVDRAQRTGKPVSIAVVDIDDFKQINSRLGPGAGDGVLRSVGSLVAESCRQYDSGGRLGSDEFLMVLPGTELDDAARAAERLRHRIEEGQFACYGKGITVTVSVGVTQADIDNGESPEEIIARATEALELARSEGGNRVRATVPLAAVE